MDWMIWLEVLLLKLFSVAGGRLSGSFAFNLNDSEWPLLSVCEAETDRGGGWIFTGVSSWRCLLKHLPWRWLFTRTCTLESTCKSMFSSWAWRPTISCPRLCVISSQRRETQPVLRPLAPAWSWAPDESVQGAAVLTAKHVYAYADIIFSMSVKAVCCCWIHCSVQDIEGPPQRHTKTLWGFILYSPECFIPNHKAAAGPAA